MTTADALLADLRRLDIRLSVNGDKLHLDAPRGALTPELHDEVRRHKPEILEALRQAPEEGIVVTVEDLLKPDIRPCWACGESAWWEHPTTGRRICSTCHPDPRR